ncbi:MAG: arginine--tRNA ligase [Candidatus Peribacteraceae bacterium]|nr:arginine--tRNA ligase [Candidatus Peribacteraceae bacterium]
MYALRQKLATLSDGILKKKFDVSTSVSFDIPRESGRGDLTSNIALQLAKQVGKSPRDIAQMLIDELGTIKGVKSMEIAGPGYVNIHLETAELTASLPDIMKDAKPKSIRKKEKPVIVEYSQPNIAKPLGVHHLLTTIIGQVITNLYRYSGYNTIAINHLGDWGTQFGKLYVAFEKWGTKDVSDCTLDDLLALYVKFHEEVEKNPELENEGRAAFAKLEQGDKKLQAFWQEVVKITMASMEKLYSQLSVSFDFTHGESFYRDKMEPIIEEGKKKKVFKTGEEGALIAEFPEASKLPPAIVMKGDGATIYMTRDLATVQFRVQKWQPAEILYVVDVAQSLYFQQLFAIVHQLGWDLPNLEHVVFGRMRFADRSMSTRKGNILKLEDVLTEAVERADKLIAEKESEVVGEEKKELAKMIGIGSVIYGVLSQNRKMDMVFDWSKVLSFEGNSAPYVQYTHTRAMSVLRKADKKVGKISYAGELTEKERALIHLLLQFSDTVESARADRMPHKLCTYLYELCQAFNAFYNSEPILKADGALRDFRLSLTQTSASLIKTGAEILTLRVPDRM